ncbi:MAG: LysR family transcriptional regulator [Colwellia sp.]|nr:LysR family transcriptional regulator [Colwellia sp.]MCW8865029.1 LysR family transcriptional regulator [Colwellia sp.]MCW9080479.1 LysR family transcriptional regulator [Colwellia sp.]
MDKWTEMQVFVEAVKRGGFSAAGRQLNLSPSAVSKLVSRLESRLEVRLFNRTTRTLNLTEGGQAFFKRCIEILEDVEDAETSITGFGHVPKGVLRINSTPGFVKHQLLPIMAEFQQLYPQLVVEFQLTGQSIDLIGEGVDLAIRLGVLKDTSLVARKLGESHRVVCASPLYLKAHGIPSTPVELLQHNCLRLSTSEIFNHWEFYSNEQEEAIEVNGHFVTDNVDALYEYALLGGGIVRLSGFMVGEDIKAGRLVPLLQDYSIKKQQIHAVFPHRKYLPAKVRVLIDFLLEKFTPNAPWD